MTHSKTHNPAPGPYLISYSSGVVSSLYSTTLADAMQEAEERCRAMQQPAHVVERATYKVVARCERPSRNWTCVAL